ncbi:hypothetical protein LSAT2_013785 [Lamellibrachia satsuma]|nr:hypothetical protein LSAT2_013785 [Lamellibrachia satsuma]
MMMVQDIPGCTTLNNVCTGDCVHEFQTSLLFSRRAEDSHLHLLGLQLSQFMKTTKLFSYARSPQTHEQKRGIVDVQPQIPATPSVSMLRYQVFLQPHKERLRTRHVLNLRLLCLGLKTEPAE